MSKAVLTPVFEEFPASNWRHVFRIFMYVILSKKSVYHEEMAMFKIMTKRIQSIVSPNVILTDRMLQDWFALNREDVLKSVRLGYEEAEIKAHMSHLEGIEDKLAIIRSMQSIAKSDGGLVSDERRLITYVAKEWQFAA